MDRRAHRLQDLFAMFERYLKRQLTGEERRLLALTDSFFEDDDPGLAAAVGESSS